MKEKVKLPPEGLTEKDPRFMAVLSAIIEEIEEEKRQLEQGKKN